jgi:hypothetical protein
LKYFVFLAQNINEKKGNPLEIRAIVGNTIYKGVLHFGDEFSEPFENLRIVSDEMYERCLQTIKGRSPHLENRTVPPRTDGRNLLTGLM